jgi:SAM-dependent methyltransferase
MNRKDIQNKLGSIAVKLLNKKVAVFGTGSVAEHTIDVLKEYRIPVAYFIDNELSKQGQTIQGITVKSPGVLAEDQNESLYILVASSYYGEIKHQLLDLGLREGSQFDAVVPTDVSTVFTNIFNRNDWNDEESFSGTGSTEKQTAYIRERLPDLLSYFNIQTVVDAPCGDFNWFKYLDYSFSQYIGIDVVDELVQKNQELYGHTKRKFLCLDITKEPIPQVDLIFCRDCLVHLPNHLIIQSLRQFVHSGSKYLLTTTFPKTEWNRDILTGQWRPINLEKKPFCLPEPLVLINEGCTEANGEYLDKSLALWRVEDLCDVVDRG